MRKIFVILAVFGLAACGSEKTRTRTVVVEKKVPVEVIKVVPHAVEVEKVVTVRDHAEESRLRAEVERLTQVIYDKGSEIETLQREIASLNSDIEVILGVFGEALEENAEQAQQIAALETWIAEKEAELESLQASVGNLEDFIAATVWTNLGVGDIQACIDHMAQYPAWGRCYVSINR